MNKKMEERIKLVVEKKIGDILEEHEKCAEYSDCSITNCKEELERAKEIAFRYWDTICAKAPLYIKIEHDYNGEIRFFCYNSYIGELEAFSDCDYFTELLSLIASNSDMSGKCYMHHAYPLRIIEFSFK